MPGHKPCVALNAHLLSGKGGYRSAGIHGYLYNTLAHLSAAAPDLALTLFTGQGDVPPALQAEVRRTPLPTQRPLMRIWWEQAAAPFHLAALKPDLLHGMAFALPGGWRGPSVVTIYDLSFMRYPDYLSAARRAYLAAAVKGAARRATRILTISQSSKAEIAELLGVDPLCIDVALPGVGEQFTRLKRDTVEAFRQAHGLPQRFVLYLGTLEPRKNLTMLLEAFHRLPQRGEVKLVLAGGKGWQFEAIFERIAQLGLAQDVLTPGYLPAEDLPLWYNAAEVFLYPSLYEGFGLPILEAMACGTPVLAAETSSLPEAAGQAGVLLPPDDPDAWRLALSELLGKDRVRIDLRNAGLQHAAAFTWARTAAETAASYRRALKQG